MTEKVVSIVDYGVANIGSMLNMLRRIGANAKAVSSPEEIASASKLILPGVGSFDHGMNALESSGLAAAIVDKAHEGDAHILGVCLGMQMLCNGSQEGTKKGLGLIEGHSERLRLPAGAKERIPHMGWKTLEYTRPSPLINELELGARFYFVHSYHVVCEYPQDVLAHAVYGQPFTAMINRGKIWGAQFHPEKSHRHGMELLRSFAMMSL